MLHYYFVDFLFIFYHVLYVAFFVRVPQFTYDFTQNTYHRSL